MRTKAVIAGQIHFNKFLIKGSSNLVKPSLMSTLYSLYILKVSVSKCDMGFELEELEHAALLVQQEEEENTLVKEIQQIELNDW